MNWTDHDGIDYEDAKRPTVDDPTNASGWIAYYAWGRGGGRMHTPNYLFRPGDVNVPDLRDHIVRNHESWMEYAESGCMVIHRGVIPPLEVVEQARKCAAAKAGEANKRLGMLTAELVKYAEKARSVV